MQGVFYLRCLKAPIELFFLLKVLKGTFLAISMPEARTANDTIQLQILDCLRDKGGWCFDQNTSSLNYLNHWGIKTKGFLSALIEDLERYHIYLKPKQNPADVQKYQFVMRWDECEDGLLIHITLSPPHGEPPRVKIAIHEHNTGYKPLSLKLIKSNNKNHEKR